MKNECHLGWKHCEKVRKGKIACYKQFLAPIAEDQRAIVMALCPLFVPLSAHSSMCASVHKLFL